VGSNNLPPVVQPPVDTHASWGNATSGNTAPSGPKPADYLIWSIITTICCCLPLGGIAIFFSVQSKSKYEAGRYAEAASNSKTAF
jgi:hypothetical protein